MPSNRLQNVTIVIVEDHWDTRSSLSRFLSSQGANVAVAADSFDGLKAIRENHPDVVLSDIYMPRRDGFELLKDIRSLKPEDCASVPVIAMTAFRESFDRRGALAAGFQEHLEKPFYPNKLLEVIDLVLKR